jgi:chromosome segregation ATPase
MPENSFIKNTTNAIGNIKIKDLVMWVIANTTKITFACGIIMAIAYYTDDAVASKYFKYKMDQFNVITADGSLTVGEHSKFLNNVEKHIREKYVLKAEMLELQEVLKDNKELQSKMSSEISRLNGSAIANDMRMEQLIEDNKELKEANKDLNKDIKAILRGIAQINNSSAVSR